MAVQPYDEVTYVTPLRLCNCLSIRWREWISCGLCIIVQVSDWVDEHTLSLRKRKNDRVVFRGDDGSFLAVHNAGRFVSVFSEDNLHILMWEDWVGVYWGNTRYSG